MKKRSPYLLYILHFFQNLNLKDLESMEDSKSAYQGNKTAFIQISYDQNISIDERFAMIKLSIKYFCARARTFVLECILSGTNSEAFSLHLLHITSVKTAHYYGRGPVDLDNSFPAAHDA